MVIADSFSLSVISRILGKLQDSGSIKRSNLARMTGLNYRTCVRYLVLLKMLQWVDFESGGNALLTGVGRDYKNKIQDSQNKKIIALEPIRC